jgi:peptidoglycan/xylan/chitin deacetylase (PgdA/CDA1 family)
MIRLRTTLRALGELTAGSASLLRLSVRLHRGCRLILAYHNVVPGADAAAGGDVSLHLPFERFRDQLDAIAASGLEVLPLDAGPNANTRSASVSISFDDAYAGALELALPELARRGWPATVFVAPGLLGSEGTWWDRLSDPRGGGLPPSIRDHALWRLGGASSEVMAHARQARWPMTALPPLFRIASEQEVVAAIAKSRLFTVGNHTWSHSNLAATDGQRASREIAATREWLSARFGDRALPILAFPYGLESPTARTAARESGMTLALRVTGGWHRPGTDSFVLPRLNIPSAVSVGGFRVRVTGLLG